MHCDDDNHECTAEEVPSCPHLLRLLSVTCSTECGDSYREPMPGGRVIMMGIGLCEPSMCGSGLYIDMVAAFECGSGLYIINGCSL